METKQKTKVVSIPFICAAGTDVGKRRDNNEDTFVFDAENGFFMVVDGMGGYEKGEVAAQIAAETVQTGIRKIEDSTTVRLRDSIILANNSILDSVHDEESEMGCVLTALIIEENTATIGHIGDTRLYKIHQNKIRKLTNDHSVVGELEEKGELSEKRLMEHPRRNEVTRCLGFEEKNFEDFDFVDVFETSFENDSAFLLCSDGLSDLLTTKQILEIIQTDAEEPQRLVKTLINKANELGGKDNITVIFVSGQEFAQTVSIEEKPEVSKIETLFSILLNRWLFLLYGILTGGGILFLFFDRIFSTEIIVPMP